MLKKITTENVLNELMVNATRVCIEKHVPANMSYDCFKFSLYDAGSNEYNPIFSNVTAILLRYSTRNDETSSNDVIIMKVSDSDAAEFKAELDAAFEKDVAAVDERLKEIEFVNADLRRGMQNWNSRSCAKFFIENRILPRIAFVHNHIDFDLENNIGQDVIFAVSRIRQAVKDIGWNDGCLRYKKEKYLAMVESLERKYHANLVKQIAEQMSTGYTEDLESDPVYSGIMEMLKSDAVQESTIDEATLGGVETVNEDQICSSSSQSIESTPTKEKLADEATATNENKGVSTMKKTNNIEIKITVEKSSLKKIELELKSKAIEEIQSTEIESELTSLVDKNAMISEVASLDLCEIEKKSLLKKDGSFCRLTSSRKEDVTRLFKDAIDAITRKGFSEYGEAVRKKEREEFFKTLRPWGFYAFEKAMLESMTTAEAIDAFVESYETTLEAVQDNTDEIESPEVDTVSIENQTVTLPEDPDCKDVDITSKVDTDQMNTPETKIESTSKTETDSIEEKPRTEAKIETRESKSEFVNGVAKKQLLTAIGIVSKGLKQKADAEENDCELYLYAHDTELEIHSTRDFSKSGSDYSVSIPATIRKPLFATVKSSLIRAIVQKSPDELIKFQCVARDGSPVYLGTPCDGMRRYTGDFLEVQTGNTRYSLVTMTDELPVKKDKLQNAIGIPAQQFRSMVESVAFATYSKKANNSRDLALKNCVFTINQDKLEMVACDKYRIARKSIVLNDDSGLQKVILINAVPLIDFIKTLAKKCDESEVVMRFNDEAVSFEYDHDSLTKTLTLRINQEAAEYYPLEYLYKLFDGKTFAAFTMRRDYLLKSLQRLEGLTKLDRKSRNSKIAEIDPVMVTCTAAPCEMNIQFHDSDGVASSTEIIPCKVTFVDSGSESVAFDVRLHLSTILNHMNGDFVSLQILENSTILIGSVADHKSQADPSLQYVIQVVNVESEGFKTIQRNKEFETAMLESMTSVDAIESFVAAWQDLPAVDTVTIKLTETDLTIRAIHQYNAVNREKIEKTPDGVKYREMILEMIPDVESGKMTLAALKSEFNDFRDYINAA